MGKNVSATNLCILGLWSLSLEDKSILVNKLILFCQTIALLEAFGLLNSKVFYSCLVSML